MPAIDNYGSPFTVAQIIDIAKISQFLAANDVERQGALYGKLDPVLSRMLYIERRAVEWKYDFEQDNETDLIHTASYLYDLCGRYGLEAQQILLNGGGALADVVTQVGTTTPTPIEFEVGVGSNILSDGENSVIISSFIGYNLIFCRNEYTESQVNRGGSYYTWNKATGSFSCYPAAQNGELFQFYPI